MFFELRLTLLKNLTMLLLDINVLRKTASGMSGHYIMEVKVMICKFSGKGTQY